MSTWHVYLVRTGQGTLYAGIATDVERRLREHETGGARAAKYLRGRGPLALVFSHEVGPRELALRVERRIKRLPRARKEELLGSDGEFASIVDAVRRAQEDPPA